MIALQPSVLTSHVYIVAGIVVLGIELWEVDVELVLDVFEVVTVEKLELLVVDEKTAVEELKKAVEELK